MIAGEPSRTAPDLPSAHLAPQYEAGADEPAVQHDAAGAAVAGAAAFLGAGQADRVANNPEQGHVRRDVDRLGPEGDPVQSGGVAVLAGHRHLAGEALVVVTAEDTSATSTYRVALS